MVEISTDCFKGYRFQPHGNITLLAVTDDLLIYHARGPFNAELLGALSYIESDVLNSLKSKGKKWGAMVVFEESCLAVDGLFSALDAYLENLKRLDLNSYATAYVISAEIEGKLFMVPKYLHCYQKAQLNLSVFDTEKEALSWLHSNLLRANQ